MAKKRMKIQKERDKFNYKFEETNHFIEQGSSCITEYDENTQFLETDAANQSLNSPHIPAYDLSTDGFTISLNYNFTDTGPAFRCVLSKLEPTLSPFNAWGIWIFGDRIGFWIYNGNAGAPPNGQWSGVDVRAGTQGVWNNFTIVVKGRDVRDWVAYNNGTIALKSVNNNGLETNNIANWTGNNTGEIVINNNYVGQNYAGIVDDIAIWNRPLDKCEISLLNSQIRQDRVPNFNDTQNDLNFGLIYSVRFEDVCNGTDALEDVNNNNAIFNNVDCTKIKNR